MTCRIGLSTILAPAPFVGSLVPGFLGLEVAFVLTVARGRGVVYVVLEGSREDEGSLGSASLPGFVCLFESLVGISSEVLTLSTSNPSLVNNCTMLPSPRRWARPTAAVSDWPDFSFSSCSKASARHIPHRKKIYIQSQCFMMSRFYRDRQSR